MANKNDDYGYFGKGIDGYVHYKQAFDRNFSETAPCKKNTTSNYHKRNQSNVVPNNNSLHNNSSKHFEPTQTVNGRTYKSIVRTPDDQQKTERLKNENPYNHPRRNKENQKSATTNKVKNILLMLLIFCCATFAIMIVPYILGLLFTGSASGADSFGGLFILLVGIVFVIFH